MKGTIFNQRDLRFLAKNSLDQDAVELDKIKRSYAQGMPLAYILGKEEFFGYEFTVNPSVLIPRPETELIVEKALEIIKSDKLNSVLDLCCGCGNIAIAIKKSTQSQLRVFASDLSLEALRIAKINADRHKAEIGFIQSDLLTGLRGEFFDIIVSNPPYVEDESIKGSLSYEPRTALSGGVDGLEVIRKITGQADGCLKEKGYLIIEIGYQHKDKLKDHIDNLGLYRIVDWIKDYSGHFRGIVLQKNG